MKNANAIIEETLEFHQKRMVVLVGSGNKIDELLGFMKSLEENEGATVTSFKMDNWTHNEFNLSFTGKREILTQVWKKLRAMGYQPTEHVEAGSNNPSFATTWYLQKENEEGDNENDYDALRIWMCFASTQCIRKQVGTTMVEQPIYEVVCKDD